MKQKFDGIWILCGAPSGFIHAERLQRKRLQRL
jgi:hypothetical protein